MPTPTRPVHLGSLDATFVRGADGSILVRPTRGLRAYPARLTERLEHWARVAPDRVFMACREHGGDWRRVTYAQALRHVRALGQALLDRKLSEDRPVAILSGNDLEHALLGLAAMHVGVPYAPISTAYSLVSTDSSKLRHILGLLTPGLVFAADGAAYGRAIRAAVPDDVELAVTAHPTNDRPATAFAELLATVPTAAVEEAAAKVGPDSIGKFLFTSGSTGLPKGVVNTQRMLCSNQAMLLEAFPMLEEEPPVIVDWLPWNHTFGGNHNVGLVLYNGGTMYIDDGKPVPSGIAETIRNLREIAPTVYFNVPKGYEELVRYLDREPALRQTFFSRVKMLFYAGAGLAQHVWDELERLAVETTGERIVMMTGLGATETAPFAIVTRPDCTGSGIVGLPAPGVELKLQPNGGKLEARLRGPNIMPGYWRMEALSREAFDADGFYKIGDALAFVDAGDWQKGFRFDGRISEDFKLATGTWVSVGPMRAKLVQRLAPWVRDAVICGHDAGYVAILMLPDAAACAALCPDAEAPLEHALVQAKIRALLRELARESTGSSTRVVRAAFLREPPSIDAGEITDKGSINQRAVIARRAGLVQTLYADPKPPNVISIED
ncbi:feruloyl-CoA synthase [Limobrevibacterium gyesilva]|uniref:Feruloyl-CoA synthase n=1 Tax=Limobrevibacterium gyesilva TaxID=2991712 RepID=A0AA41YTD7_9PROT|nr:feruloyl-CoA synthase [Limobrevibacterium gyesilva]MCW3476213.1 feruloyl-CoA synthase [Limobrevibacterium gyesilva]